MRFLTIEYIKAHSRIDFDCEDALLELYGSSAEETVLQICEETYEEMMKEYGSIPGPVRQVALMLVDVSYNHRSPLSPQNMSRIPYSFDMLLTPYIRSSDNTMTQMIALGNLIKSIGEELDKLSGDDTINDLRLRLQKLSEWYEATNRPSQSSLRAQQKEAEFLLKKITENTDDNGK